jgi:hypothetical protein
VEEAAIDLLEFAAHRASEAIDLLVDPLTPSRTSWILSIKRSATTSKWRRVSAAVVST